MDATESKYEAPAGTALPLLDGLPRVAGTRGPDEEQLEAGYYDPMTCGWFARVSRCGGAMAAATLDGI